MRKIYLFPSIALVSCVLLAQGDNSSQLLPKFNLADSNLSKDFDPDKEVDSFEANKKMMLQYLQDKTQCVQSAKNQEQLSGCKVFQSSSHGEENTGRKKSHSKRSQSFGSD